MLPRESFQDKISGIVGLATGALTELFGVKELSIAIVAPGNDKRLRSLIRWTEERLRRLHAEQFAPLFLFSAQDAATTSVEAFFCGSWIVPFSSEPVSLLDCPDITAAHSA